MSRRSEVHYDKTLLKTFHFRRSSKHRDSFEVSFIFHVYFCQFHKGRHPIRERWVFGLFYTQFTPARPYFQLVRRRNANTLLPITQAEVQPGSLLYSDQWAAYRNI